ncbi:efflux RND transporter periplasmic adaptor subunit [Paracoccus sp. NGMCC 1.201697]|uniref:Efflux RND transporter periplasmic adaptor subunit n=1 Tax=Paracoccus broussonetiae subsp. drimophilus TaxID=3373869 RepID=A0ABW7LRP3_9RHOB
MTAVTRNFGKLLLTLAMVVCAAVLGWNLWSYYMLAPWTRDGHVRADIVGVAPDVSGLVTEVLVKDNDVVTKGQPLFRVDPARYGIAVETAEAGLAASQAAMDFAKANADRREHLAKSSVASVETLQQARATYLEAEAAFQQAKATLDLAKLNLDRSTVTASVSGKLTNFTLQPGAYASAGARVASLIAAGTIRVSGYFEETKLTRIHVGDHARVTLMKGGEVLTGTVLNIAGGIADQQRSEAAGQLPNVAPTFTWVRLAQRVPVDIELEGDKADHLIVGSSATVEILPVK